AHGPIAAAFSAEPNALALELRKIGQRVAYREKPKNLMVETTERHQVRCEPAVRNAPLHKSDLNAGIRIIQQSEVFFRATGLAQIHLNSGPRQYALIAGAENVVMLTLRRGRDCDLRRGGAGMRYVTPSQVRMAIHSIAAVILKTCQRVITRMNVSVRQQGEQNCSPETKPHRLRSGYTCCHDRGNGTCRSAIGLKRTCVPLTASVC